MDEPTRNEFRKRRVELQNSLEKQLKAVCCRPPTAQNLEEFSTVLKDPAWVDLKKLGDLMNVEPSISGAKPFPTHFHKLLGFMLADISTYEQYLQRFIIRFEAENELVVLKSANSVIVNHENQKNRRLLCSRRLCAPIHSAVLQLHQGFLDWLLKSERTNVNLRNEYKETALAILSENYYECLRPKRSNTSNTEVVQPPLALIRALIKRLLAAGASFNICSVKLKLPIELLLSHVSTDDSETMAFVQQCVQQAGSALAVVKTEGSSRLVGFLNNHQHVRLTEELFEIFLRYKDVEKFTEYWPRFNVTKANVKKVIRLLLHTTLDRRLPHCLRLVVDKGGPLIFAVVAGQARNVCVVGDQRSGEMEHRVELKGLLRKACMMADLSVLQLLVQKITDLVFLNDDPLLALTLSEAFKPKRSSAKRTALLACAEFLVDTHKVYKLKTDGLGNTPLHLALKNELESMALTLLKLRNSYLGLRNLDNHTLLNYGTYEFWKVFLDQCIELKGVPGNYRKKVFFNLTCLNPFPHVQAEQSGAHRGDSNCKNIQGATNANNRPGHYEHTITEMSTLCEIAQSKTLKPLLMHPLIQTFILVKWMRLSHWNYLNLALIILVVVFFGTFSLTTCLMDEPNPALKRLGVLATVLLAAREFLQILVLRKSYMSFENMLDLGNVVAMSFVLCQGCSGFISSLVLIQLARQVTFLLGSLPFKCLSTKMSMFKTALKNLLQFFVLLIPLAEVLFYAINLIYENPQIQKPLKVALQDWCTDDDCAESHTFLNATIQALWIMASYLVDVKADFVESKERVFRLFLFIVPIVIINLINSLAVSNVTAICKESELINVIKKVMLLEQYERCVANIRPAFLRKLFPRPFFEEHNCWIQVRATEFRKIEVHPKQKTKVAMAAGNTHRKQRVKFVPISILPCFGDVYSNELLNFRFFKFAMFMRLDQSILDEALAIYEKR